MKSKRVDYNIVFKNKQKRAEYHEGISHRLYFPLRKENQKNKFHNTEQINRT